VININIYRVVESYCALFYLRYITPLHNYLLGNKDVAIAC